MFALILGAVGLLGGGGIAALVAKFGFKVVFGTARTYARKVPPKVWLGLAVAAALVGGYLGHQHVSHKRLEARFTAGYAKGYADAKADQVAAQVKANARAAKINSTVRKETDEKDRTDTAFADDLRLRGPGKARACPPATASATGGYGEAAAKPDAAGPQVPRGDWIAVPYNWLVDRAEEHDHLLNEDHAWRKADDLQRNEAGGSQ